MSTFIDGGDCPKCGGAWVGSPVCPECNPEQFNSSEIDTRRGILEPVHSKDLICFWYPGWKLASVRAWWKMRPWRSPFWERFLDWSGDDMVLRPYNDIEEAQQIQDKKIWFWWECRPWRLHD